MATEGIQQVLQEVEKNRKLNKATKELLGRLKGIPCSTPSEEVEFDGVIKCKVSVVKEARLDAASRLKGDGTCIINVMNASGLDYLIRRTVHNDEVDLCENTNLAPVFLSETAREFLSRPARFEGRYGSPCALYSSGVTIFRHDRKMRKEANWERVNVLSVMLPSFYRKSAMFEQPENCSLAYNLVLKRLRYVVSTAVALEQTKLIFGDFNNKTLKIPEHILVSALYSAIGSVSDRLEEVIFSTKYATGLDSRLRKTFL